MFTCCWGVRLFEFSSRLALRQQKTRVFTDMERWIEIRRRVLGGEISKRAACQQYEIHWDTLQKILTHTEPPGYRLTKRRPSKLEPFLPVIEETFPMPAMEGSWCSREARHEAERGITTERSQE